MIHRLAARIWWSVLVCLATGQGAGADDNWPVRRGPSREPVPFRFDPAAVKKVPRAFLENSPACILYSATSHFIEGDGTVETITHDVTRLNGRKGIDNLGEYQHIVFDPRYQKLTLNLARIHKPGGKIVDIEPHHVQLHNVATDYLIYDTDKQFVISFPNLEVGDVYEVKWTVRGKNPEFGDNFFSRYTFGDDRHPVVQDELHVVIPKDKTFHHAAVNGKLDPDRKDMGEQRHYRWVVRNRPELGREEDRPSLEELRLQVALSTFPDWAAVAKWKQRLRAECWTCTPEVRRIIEQLAGPHKTPLDKARTLTYWVRRQIRYVSRGPSGLGYTPHLPHQVLNNLYGDCKDQAQLLAVMLKEIGLPVYLVTLGTLDDGQVLKDVPSPWGTHALLLVKIDDKDHWIDTTASQAAWDYLPRSDRNRQAYITRDAELLLVKTPAFSWQDQRYEHVSDLVVKGDGSSTTRRHSTYHGGAGLSRRDVWLETPLGERRRLVTQELQDAHSRSRLVDLRIDDKNLLDFDRPVSAALEFHIPRHFTGDDGLEGSLTDSIVWNRLLAYNLDLERKLPLQLPSPFTSVHKYRIRLPAALRFDGVPHNQKVQSRWGFHSLSVKHDRAHPRVLDLVMETRLEKDRVDPAHFAEFQKFHEDVYKAYRVWINIKPTREVADAPLLETLLALAPGCDKQAAETLARLYLDNDRSADARRVLDTALFYHLREPSLWDLRVKSAETYAEEEKTYRTMIGLFPKNKNYQLALGTVLVKRHNHAGARKVLEPLTADKSDQLRAQVHYQLARTFFQAKEYPASLKHVEAARVAEAAVVESTAAWHFVGRVQLHLGNKAEAIAAYRKALALDAQAANILAELIKLQLGDSQAKDTLDLVRRYTLVAGKDQAALAQAADFHYRLGRLDDAFELANRARDLGYNARAQRILGLVHLRHGELTLAIFHLDRADSDAEVAEGLVRAHLGLGQLELAATRLGKIESRNPALEKLAGDVKELTQRREAILRKLSSSGSAASRRAVDAYVCADEAYRRRENPIHVAKLLQAAFAEEGMQLAEAFALRAQLQLEGGKIAAARADADQAFSLDSSDGRAHLVRGRVKLLRGDKSAIGDLEQAVKLSHHADAHSLHWLAAAQFQAGQRERALANQRRAVELNPRDEELRAQLREFER